MHTYTNHTANGHFIGYTVAPTRPFVPSQGRSWPTAPVAAPRPTVSPLVRLGLTDREREVAELASFGYSYAQIARTLFVAQTTVGYHLSNIYAKCGVRSRHQLAELVRGNAAMAG